MNSLSRINPKITLNYVQETPESLYFERKSSATKPPKIANEIIGMLNADGGVLIVGISDDGKEFEDLNEIDSSKIEQLRSVVFDNIKPAPNVYLEECVLVTGELIFIYHVNQNHENVYSRNDGKEDVFLRVHDSNRLLDRDRVRQLEHDKNIRQYEDQTVREFNPEDLNIKLLKYYANKLSFHGDLLDLLVNRHVAVKEAGKYLFKRSAILLFSNNPEKYIPSAVLRYVRYDGIIAKVGINHNVIKDETFSDNIPRIIEIFKRFMRASLKDFYFLDIRTGTFPKVPEYPEDAWLEGIVNALCHRSYNIQGNPIMVKHFDDRIEISNSGPLPGQVTVNNIKNVRYSRNPRIALILQELGYVRRLNEGVSRIYESMENSMLSIPEYSEKHGNVYLVLRNKISAHDKSISSKTMDKIRYSWDKFNETQRDILIYLFRYQKANLEELESHIKIHQNSIRRYLNEFCKNNFLEKLSEKQRDKNAYYSFKQH